MKPTNHRSNPPPWATRLLRWFCAPHLLEEIQGDLQEEFDFQLRTNGPEKARLDYVINVLGFCKPFAIKRKPSASTTLVNMKMFKHYLMVSFRNIFRQKSFSLINITGLAFGMTCCLFIYLWVKDERKVDNFHTNGDRLFRMYQTIEVNGEVSGNYATPTVAPSNQLIEALSLEQYLKKAIPAIQYATSYATGYDLPWGHPETFQVEDKMFKLEGSRAGADFFKMFDFPLVAGDAEHALKDVNSLSISRKMAALFFASPQDAIGKSIRFENRLDFTISAVFEDLPANSTMRFDYLVSWETFKTQYVDASSNDWLTFIQINDRTDPRSVEVSINKYIQSKLDKNSPVKVTAGLQLYADQYLHSHFVNGKPEGGRIEYVKIFSGVAIFILVIACINFMNLATARSIRRAKEVGVRKVVGSSRGDLIIQFFGESMLLSFLALILSLVLAHLLLPAFNTLADKNIVSPVTDYSSWIFLVGLMLFTGFFAGSYPALFLSSLKPVSILKGRMRFTTGSIWFRKGLAGFQFVLSIVLLIATIVVSRQTSYVQNTHLGYDRENLIYIRVEGELNPKYNVFKQRAESMPGIALVDRSSEAPHAMGFTVVDAINWEGKPKDAQVGFKPSSVGYDFLKLMNLKLADGRDFSRSFGTDTSAFMINEEALKQMDLKDPIGKWISAWGKKGHIIGILKNYHTHSLHEPIKPLILDVKEDLYFGVLMVKTEPGKTQEALASLEHVYKEVNPSYPFVYQFLDREYAKLYSNEKVITRLSNVFAGLAILISCLGLLGLAIFSAEQRTKEIGIRKVLGATIPNIMTLLSRDFLALVFISFFIAAPIAGYFMYEWLQGFAFQIELSWWIFALAGAFALFIALATISVQTLQSAFSNPTKALRSE
jgi:putative ABC transport system permease protein